MFKYIALVMMFILITPIAYGETLCINLPDEKLEEIILAASTRYGYTEQVGDPVTKELIPNPVTRKAFVGKYIKRTLIQNAKEELLNRAANKAYRAEVKRLKQEFNFTVE